ncbi:MAG: arylsulfatase [Pseudomonadota bacterium]
MTRPNIILILADDLGFSDLGCTGSEIRTPHIDSLAENGALMSAMYNCARCCPTRASLLTGQYPHNAGVGHMGADLGTPAYQGYLSDNAVTIAEALREAGYFTAMSGKWHVGGDYMANDIPGWRVGEPGHPTPRQRGFDRFYGIVDGVTHFFSPHYLMRDDERIEAPDDYYFTDAITDEALDMIDEAGERPFFLYLAHTAPHWPLHAPPEDIARYEGVYAKGWDATRTARHEEMLAKDVVQGDWPISPRDPDAPAWEDVEHQDWQAAKMAVYAAMIDRMDQNVGRVLAHLKAKGAYDNTLILFLSDNGGCAEFMAEDGWAQFFPDRTNNGRKIAMGNRPDIRPGDALTYQSYDLPWANVSNTPFRLFKHWSHEGGISTPLLAQWPARFGQSVRHDPWHVCDILPTLLDAAGAAYPGEHNGRLIRPADGESFLQALTGREAGRQQPIYFEHEGNAAIRAGDMKLVRTHASPWELYDMANDRTELNDLAGRGGKMEQALRRDYDAWASDTGVLDWDDAFPLLQQAWGIKSASG